MSVFIASCDAEALRAQLMALTRTRLLKRSRGSRGVALVPRQYLDCANPQGWVGSPSEFAHLLCFCCRRSEQEGQIGSGGDVASTKLYEVPSEAGVST
jgi:hypothetical protein